jgi:pimeloyl-ACP methyl ester carboxylesterase
VKVHLLSGINTFGIAQSLGLVAEKLFEVGFKKEEVIFHPYGFPIVFGTAWLRNKFIARRISKHIKPDDIVIGHSNGAALAWLIAEQGALFAGAILIDPALDAGKAIAKQVKWIHVFYNECDTVVNWSKWIPFHIWGDQGKVGYLGNDSRYIQHHRTFVCH